MDITANARTFILREQFEYINSKNYQLQYYIFSAIGKVSFWKKKWVLLFGAINF